jgi:RNA polymerase sigma-70 factor (ECF subfamily)
MIHDMTLSSVLGLEASTREADETLQMDEDTFRALYDRTARPLWMYLARMTGDSHTADDLLQETYYRFLRVRATFDGEAHQRNYLYRIATNLVRDAHRRQRDVQTLDAHAERVRARDFTQPSDVRTDVSRAMARLKPRERELLWLAYAEGSSHQEIAAALGVKTGSIKLLLFRARRRLAGLLTRAGTLNEGRRQP